MPLFEDFAETFDGTSLPAGWAEMDGASVPYAIGGGEVTWDRDGVGIGIGGIMIIGISYDLADSVFTTHLYASVGGDTAIAGPIIQLLESSGSGTLLLYANYPMAGQFYFSWTDAATNSPHADYLTYVPTDEWIRIRDTGGGIIAVETGPDGTSWTTRGTTSSAVHTTTGFAGVVLGSVFPADGAGTVVLDQVGAPTGPVLTEVTATAEASWYTDGPLVSTATARWDAEEFVPPEALATARWNVTGAVTSTRTARWHAYRLPVVITGATAEATATAGAGEFEILPGKVFPGATATARAAATPGALVLGPAPPIFVGATAYAIASANEGQLVVGDHTIGDPFALPVDLSGLTGAATANLAVTTIQPGEPYTHGATRTWWFRYTAAGPGLLTITSTDTTPHWIDVYDGDTLDSLTLQGSAERTSGAAINLTVPVSYGSVYIRIATSTADPTLTISYSAEVIAPELIVENRTPRVTDTPATIRVGVANAEPNEAVRFEWYPPITTWVPAEIARPIELITLDSDETGTILSASVPLAPAVPAGTYTIYARGLSSDRDATLSVVVENTPAVDIPDDDAEPPTFEVGRWSLYDPTELGTYTFPANPASMTAPYAPRNVTVEHTTAPSGQPIMWEGGLTAHDWTFAGHLDTEEFHDALVSYADLNRRFYLRDHRSRTWIVSFTGLDMRPRRSVGKPWAHDYTVQAHIYGEVVT